MRKMQFCEELLLEKVLAKNIVPGDPNQNLPIQMYSSQTQIGFTNIGFEMHLNLQILI